MKTQQNNRFDEQKNITSLKCWVWKLKPRRKITLFSTSSPTLDLYDLETGRSEAKWRTTNRAIRELWFLGKMSLVKFTLASPLSPVLLSWNLILYLINIYINKFHVDQEHSTGVDVLPLRIYVIPIQSNFSSGIESNSSRIITDLFYFALWLDQETSTTSFNQSSHSIFPALHAVCLFLLRVLNTPSPRFHPVWLAVYLIEGRCIGWYRDRVN